MKKYTNVERPESFVPLGSDYSRFVAMQEAKRIKRIPEAGASLPKMERPVRGDEQRVRMREGSPEVRKLQDRMKQSLDMDKPKPADSKPSSTPEQDSEMSEIDLFKKLHGTSFDPKSKRDRRLLGYIKNAASEAGGYGDFKAIKNLAYSQQYGPDSNYTKAAKSWREKQKSK